MDADPRQLLRALFDAALAAAAPETVLPPFVAALRAQAPRGRTIVVGAGKAAAAMARAVETHWPGELSGIVVTRYGHGVTCERIEVVEAAHPVPDAAGAGAARRVLESVRGLSEDDLVICLLSGGGSALLALPADGVGLAEKQAINRALLRSGATIGEINTVRRHLSAVKGGRLAMACTPARVVTLAISDVPGDDLATIASGPTVADPTTAAEALAVIDRYRIPVSATLRDFLASGCAETPKPGDPRFARCASHLVATPQQALEAAAAAARARGLAAHVLSDRIEGESREAARVVAAIARQVADRGQPFSPPCVLLSGGETTVTIRGDGRGGPNAEFLLALAIDLGGHPRIHALAADTDGIDGSEDNAGAIADPTTLVRAVAAGVDPPACLGANDSYAFFAAIGDLLVTGPTRTNVNDFRAVLVV